MKVRIFNKGKGWYISATNYKDKNDKAYVSVYFPQHTEPDYIESGNGYSVRHIDIIEGKFTAYQGKVGLTVFKYEFAEDIQPVKDYSVSHGTMGADIRGIDYDLPFDE